MIIKCPCCSTEIDLLPGENFTGFEAHKYYDCFCNNCRRVFEIYVNKEFIEAYKKEDKRWH